MRPSLALITAFVSSGTALEALSNSPCAVQCGNDLGGTTGADIACHDSDYGTTPGQTFKRCVGCQLTSNYVDPATKQTDLQWAISSPTDAVALDAACQQQPSSGNTISYSGNIFSETLIQISNPSSGPQSTFSQSSGGLTLGAKIGIAVGAIVFAFGLAGFCIVWNGRRRRRQFLARHQQQSGYADWLAQQEAAKQTGYADWLAQQEIAQANASGAHQGTPVDAMSAGSFFDSPQSTRPLVSSRPWAPGHSQEESPMSAVGEKVYFSPYSSNYSSPVTANDQAQAAAAAREWPRDRKGSIPGLGRSRSGDEVDREDGDRIEMQNVPPVLLHPGHGRAAFYPPGLGEEDMKKGDAM
ncbi:hypothetical protein LOCC1_G000216 [Lachnellula occidentalis]|uniref:Uncharacterized protein n=1 Tax=Lachnellula occidentalis TaxID=215460 RepID=A0A8H8S9P2_9HELO|nr:hypothetical protein LOCC1_G000216 [Lachnellula occidentalis]